MALSWKMGFEVELMAPPGRSRADLAARTARRLGGTVRRFFHPQSEPSIVPGQPVFENLTLGFEVLDSAGRRLAAFVDDLTLQRDLDRQAAPRAGWYRIIADDGRLLQLTVRHCDAEAPLESVLDPLAALFGTATAPHASGMVRIEDARGVSVAIGAPLPGERERPCEIVTAPVEADHERVIQGLLEDACAEGFAVPVEGATHIHFDATPLRSAAVIARLVETLSLHGDALKQLVGVNPHCVRLGPWPDTLKALVLTPGFRALAWPEATEALSNVGLTKYCDFNLLNIALNSTSKYTFEVRVLPAHLDAAPILEAAALFEALLRWACETATARAPPPLRLARLIDLLPMPRSAARVWRARAAAPA
ncbi:MAG TPA: amidoligase family protein [Caulobacteraceae bacterium]|jgi:hypothetical protein|nr:amidoligase family protein [Caulobacteraceae bacterium]